ncbi:MAG: aminotransferase class V-fold PLP-dependent enzyme, partial [Gammaproteobacteria bacterium]
MNTQGFNLSDDIIYLNHAAVSPWPEKTVKAVQQFAKENGEVGSQQYLRWMQTEANLREQLRELINAPGCDEIALLKSTSEALSVIAYGLEWGPGDQIVIPEQEFPSNRIVWESLRPRGVDVVPIDLIDEDSPEDKLINAFTEHTR